MDLKKQSVLSNLGQAFPIICQFLEVKEKLRLSSINHLFRKIILNGNNWGQFCISDCRIKQQNWDNMLDWVQKYLPIIQPKLLNIVVFDHCQDQKLLNIFINDILYVDKLTLCCQSVDLHLLLSKTCSQITHLSVRSNAFSNAIFQYMCGSMKKIIDFQVFKDDQQFTCKNISNYFQNQIQRLVLKPHMIQFQQLVKFLYKCGNHLVQLEIDVQQCSQETLIQILETLNSIQILRIYHVQHIEIPDLLSKALSPKMRQFGLTKAYKMPMYQIMDKITSKNLIVLDFTQILMLSDDELKLVSDRCPYLKKLNISWCMNLNQEGIKYLIEKCKLLQYLNVTGLKNLTDKVFLDYFPLLESFKQPEYDQLRRTISKNKTQKQLIELQDSNKLFFLNFQKQKQKFSQINSLRNLRQLNTISCNNISDKILKIIYCVNRKVNVINYYSNPLGLYTKELQDDYY